MNKEKLREEFKQQASFHSSMIGQLSGYELDKIATWWLSKFQTILKEIESEIGEEKKGKMETEADDDGFIDGEALFCRGFNKAKDQDIEIISKYIKSL